MMCVTQVLFESHLNIGNELLPENNPSVEVCVLDGTGFDINICELVRMDEK